ncbi:MAG: di-trans,poly-cis-decaprenylcistransferase [Parcubacteria group bacterium]|nr:di-trans,poly-cis-decaprenylcistransferase [Parcubacteria group bacterium]
MKMDKKVPKHIAVIPDGNRRWSRQKGLKPWEGHDAGAKVVEKFLDWCLEYKIPIISFYALSIDNLKKRPEEEVKHIINVLKNELMRLAEDERVHNNGVRVKVLGDIKSLPEDIRKAADYVMEKTKKYKNITFNILMPYSGRYEILKAIENIIGDIKNGKLKDGKISKELFEEYLFTKGIPDPDLVIRTGEKRMSDFLIWQTAYSEIFFIEDKYWPDFNIDDFKSILEEFSNRKRRFGE